ncbi:MAG: SBBP repeat-containing protein, partial [bacterium]|nr:SBBP repeat-containing protein [bacterium]
FTVFISKLNLFGTELIFSTFIGGSSDEESYDIAVDNTGCSYITGYTISTDFPVTANAFQQTNHGWLDVFVSKLNLNGSALVYSTYLGGSSMYNDIGYGIALDSCGNVYITGETQSTDFPISHNAWDKTLNGNNDVFISKLNTTGSLLLYSTFLGGSSIEQSSAIKVDNDGNIYLTGYTESPDFPTTFDSLDTSHNGNRDVFVSKLNILPSPTGIDSLLWKSYSKYNNFRP